MKLLGIVWLVLNSKFSFGALTFDDLVVDKSWVPVVDSTRRNSVPNDDVLKLEEGLIEATRRVEQGAIDPTGPVDCFGLNPVLQFVFRWMFKPWSKETINARFYLITREVPWKNELKSTQECVFGDVTWFKNRPTIVIVHGFMSNSDVFWVNDMAEALLENNDYNVIVVDWGGGSESWKYWRAVANTRVVGLLLAQMLDKLISCGKLDRSQVHCIGHSLGAHICSFAARKLGPLGRITGLDPAEPCFKDNGLNTTDALYVDVIHTNTAIFGRSAIIGVKDFYPNGGKFMPGCVLRGDLFLDKLNIVKQLEGAICSHGRSYEYFIDSLRNCKFWGRSWDFTPTGSLAALKKECSPLDCAPLGLESINYPGNGGYFVPTRDKTPFCVPDPRVSRSMEIWKKIESWLVKHN